MRNKKNKKINIGKIYRHRYATHTVAINQYG